MHISKKQTRKYRAFSRCNSLDCSHAHRIILGNVFQNNSLRKWRIAWDSRDDDDDGIHDLEENFFVSERIRTIHSIEGSKDFRRLEISSLVILVIPASFNANFELIFSHPMKNQKSFLPQMALDVKAFDYHPDALNRPRYHYFLRFKDNSRYLWWISREERVEHLFSASMRMCKCAELPMMPW